MDTTTRSFRRKRFLLILLSAILLCLFLARTFRETPAPGHAGRKGPVPSDTGRIGSSGEDVLVFRGTVRKGMNLSSILENEMLERDSILEIISITGGLYDLKKIKAGNSYSVTFDLNGFKTFRYDIERDRYLAVRRTSGGLLEGEIVVIPYKLRYSLIEGVIDGSLYETLSNAEPGGGELSDSLASLYEYDIDFNRDIRRGDSFSIFVEKLFLDGKFAGYGKIISAEFTNRGETTTVIRFAAERGSSSYFHPDGKAVRKMFLRCPLPFMRLTSGFGFRRHPVLGFSSSHKGIDLGAPSGTVVRATADGRVSGAGYDGVRGRYLIVSHGNRYRTHYYHLSRIKKGIVTGKRVSQGTVIGYVGNTGRSTGPHLHYGLQQSGRFLSPLRLKSPSIEPVKAKDMERFRTYSGVIMALMDLGRSPVPEERIRQLIYRTVLSLLDPNI